MFRLHDTSRTFFGGKHLKKKPLHVIVFQCCMTGFPWLESGFTSAEWQKISCTKNRLINSGVAVLFGHRHVSDSLQLTGTKLSPVTKQTGREIFEVTKHVKFTSWITVYAVLETKRHRHDCTDCTMENGKGRAKIRREPASNMQNGKCRAQRPRNDMQ